MESKKITVLGKEVEEKELKRILKDVLNMRGVEGEIRLYPKGDKPINKKQALYKYAFFDCLG